MNQAVEMIVRGLKCDAPSCDYRDDTVKLADYEASIDRPCPTCGASLLTRADFEATKRLIAGVAVVNEIFADLAEKAGPDAERERIAIEMNGTGSVTLRMPAKPERATD
jgi:hypothetical protein